VATGEKLDGLLPDKHGVKAFSPDGRRLAMRGETTVLICDTTTGKPITPELAYLLPGHNPELGPDRLAQHDCEFSPDGSRLAVACGDNTARICDAATGKEITLVRHRRDVRRASFSPDGRWLLTASDDSTAQVWDAASGAPVSPPLKHSAPVFDASFSHDGYYVVTASSDGTARVWQARTGRPMTPPLWHAAPVTRASFSSDGNLIVTGSDDHTARVWNWRKVGLRVLAVQHPAVVQSVSVSRDSRNVVAVCVGGAARLWDLSSGKMFTGLQSNLVAIRCARFSPDGRLLATGTTDGLARVWYLESGLPVSPSLIHRGLINHVEFDPDGKRILTAGSDQVARIWEVNTGRLLSELRVSDSVNDARFAPDGRRVVTVSVSAPVLFHVDMYERWSFDPAEREAITANWGQAQLWNADTSQPITPPRKLGTAVSEVALSPDGTSAIPACGSRALTENEVWATDLVTGRRRTQPFRHDRGVIHVSFSPDGRRVVTASWDHAARVWNAATAEPIGPPLSHEKSVHHAEFSSDSRLVATASEDQTARVWDAATGEPVTPPLEHRAVVQQALFSPDGRRLLTTSADGLVRVIELPRTSRSIEEEVRLAQFLAGHWIDDTGAPLPINPRTMREAWLVWRAQKTRDNDKSSEPVPGGPVTAAEREDEAEELEAKAALQRAVLDSQSRDRAASSFRKLSKAVSVSSNQWAELIELCSQAICFEPRGGGPYQQRAIAYEQIGQFHSAILDIREYLWIKGPPLYKGDDSEAFELRGRCYLQLGEAEKAEADFQTVLKSTADNSSGYNNLAWFYVTGPTNLRSPEKALPLALKAVELGKTNHNELNTLGVVYYRLGQLTNAITTLETGIKADTAGGSAHDFFFLAMAYQGLGDTVKAAGFFSKATNWVAAEAMPAQTVNTELDAFRAEAEEALATPKPK
jgi:WD40 repeat protein/tetratricopeptide (TPR) repeat protein